MHNEVSFGALNYLILFGYLALLFYIGVRSSGKQETTEDLFLAKRNMPWLAVGMSMFASMTSAISYLGIPGIAYKENGSMLVMGIVSPLLAPILIFLFYPFYRRLNVTTSYEYIGLRFGKAGRYAIAILFLLARLSWLGVVLYAPAVALSATCGLDIKLSIALMGVVSIVYTTIGGLAAVIWTDIAQYLIMTAGAICVVISLIGAHPQGLMGIIHFAQSQNHLGEFSLHLDWFALTPLMVIISLFFSSMQDYGTDQVTVQRLLAAKDMKGVTKAIIFNSLTDLAMTAMLAFIGLGMFAYYSLGIAKIPANIPGDSVLPYFIMHAFPVGVSGLIITAIYAAAMSAASAGANSVVTVAVNDLIRPVRKTVHADAADLKLSRYLTLGVGFIATGIAIYASTLDSLLKASQNFLSAFAAPVLALFLLGMLTRKAHFWGWLIPAVIVASATLCMPKIWLVGGGVVFSLAKIEGARQIHYYWYFPIAFMLVFTLGYILSWILPGKHGAPEYTVWGRHALPSSDAKG